MKFSALSTTHRMRAPRHRHGFATRGHASRGFTLIETLLYIALTAFIMTGVIVSAYSLFTSTDHLSKNVTAEGEALFVMRKISWLLNQASVMNDPVVGTPTNRIEMDPASAQPMSISLISDAMQLSLDDDTTFIPLTATRAKISNFIVNRYAPAGGIPAYIEYSFRAGDRDVGPIRHYLYF